MASLLNKYSPKTISELTCNRNAVSSIISWIEMNNETRECNNLLITGKHGIGKSKSINVILKELKFDIQTSLFTLRTDKKGESQSSSCVLTTEKEIHTMLKKLSTCQRVYAAKMVILIDELETITASVDQTHIMSLLKINETHRYCPIIIISNGQHGKLLSNIKKMAMEIKFVTPKHVELYKIITIIASNEKIMFFSSQLENIKNSIVNHSQFDIRRLFLILEDIKLTFKNKCITRTDIDDFLLSSKQKDIDVDLFKATETLLYDYESLDTCLKHYETEKVLLPLMVQQYYVKHITTNVNDPLNTLQACSDALSFGDVIENNIYSEQNWDLANLHGFYSCVMPSFMFRNRHRTLRIPLKFAEYLNNTSIKNRNKINIQNAGKCFNNMNIFDLLYASRILRTHINNGSSYNSILRDYNAQMDQIEALLKIDKMQTNTKALTTKQKRELDSCISP